MPQLITFNFDREYDIKNDGSNIKLDVTIGDAKQSSDMTVKLNTKKLLSEFKQSVKGLVIGADTGLKGAILRINGNIADTSKDSNKISITVKVSGGVDTLTKKFSVNVDQEGETVVFSFIVRFTV
jgi:hypothetical protein